MGNLVCEDQPNTTDMALEKVLFDPIDYISKFEGKGSSRIIDISIFDL